MIMTLLVAEILQSLQVLLLLPRNVPQSVNLFLGFSTSLRSFKCVDGLVVSILGDADLLLFGAVIGARRKGTRTGGVRNG
jgi:hypothetical protein